MQSILRANYSFRALACSKGVSRRFVDIAGQTANQINIKRYSLFSIVNSSFTSASLMELEQKYIIHQIVPYMPSTITFNRFSFHLLGTFASTALNLAEKSISGQDNRLENGLNNCDDVGEEQLNGSVIMLTPRWSRVAALAPWLPWSHACHACKIGTVEITFKIPHPAPDGGVARQGSIVISRSPTPASTTMKAGAPINKGSTKDRTRWSFV